ncbi:hypothetical protein [Ectobacillus sp. sgz5001026]|uniref:hypothetical protein n=1 Tax=Ectobacillus sp. sgz5001026 TaxID=3242473 RepID=UPI0036D2381E
MKSKIIWSALIAINIGIVLYGAYIFIPNLFGKQSVQVNSTSQQFTQVKANNIGDQVVPQFISKEHQILNSLTGWGQINNPDWNEVHQSAKEIVDSVSAMNDTGNEDLQKDIKDIRSLAETLTTGTGKGDLIKLHRYFHDLDVVMNQNDGAGKYYGITSWGRTHR